MIEVHKGVLTSIGLGLLLVTAFLGMTMADVSKLEKRIHEVESKVHDTRAAKAEEFTSNCYEDKNDAWPCLHSEKSE